MRHDMGAVHELGLGGEHHRESSAPGDHKGTHREDEHPACAPAGAGTRAFGIRVRSHHHPSMVFPQPQPG